MPPPSPAGTTDQLAVPTGSSGGVSPRQTLSPVKGEAWAVPRGGRLSHGCWATSPRLVDAAQAPFPRPRVQVHQGEGGGAPIWGTGGPATPPKVSGTPSFPGESGALGFLRVSGDLLF